jgi:hypothetical protein
MVVLVSYFSKFMVMVAYAIKPLHQNIVSQILLSTSNK